MKLLKDCSNYAYNIGTNPAGGGYIVLLPETKEEEEYLQEKASPGSLYYWRMDGGWHLNCRLVKHVGGIPMDGGINPAFVEIVQRYRLRTAGYPNLLQG